MTSVETWLERKKSRAELSSILLKFTEGDTTTEIAVERADPNEEAEIATRVLQQLNVTKPVPTETLKPRTTPLSTVISEYRAEKATEGAWTAKSTAENTSIFRLLVDITGDFPVKTVDAPIAREVKKVLQQLPPNLNMDPKYRDKTIEHVCAMSPSRTLSISTVNKYLSRMASLFEWS